MWVDRPISFPSTSGQVWVTPPSTRTRNRWGLDPLPSNPSLRSSSTWSKIPNTVRLACDRNQIEKVGESNIGTVASPTGLVLPNQQKYLAPAYANATFTVDTNKANQLLQSAGYTKGSDGIYADKNGKKLSFNLTFT